MIFTERELEVIGHSLNHLYEEVKEMYEEGSGDGEPGFIDYLNEIKNIQTRITDNMPNEIIN